MSSDDSSGSSEPDSEPEETLVAGRAKRSTAGNRLSHLLQHLEDEDVKADLLAEEEDDQRDYTASEDGDADGDGDVESSDEDDDEGPPREGQEEALEGEQELKKQERAESKKKRKARDLVRVQPMRPKRVKIADEASDVRETAPAPKKKRLDRSLLIEDTSHGPVRQSSRAHTMANAEITKAKLIESNARAVKTQEVMRLAAEKKAAEAAPALTQADRLARALEIEKENSKSLNRWERAEQERVQAQKEKLEALRHRKLDGPVIKYWSGPVMWEWRQGKEGKVGERVTYKVPSSLLIEEVHDPEKENAGPDVVDGPMASDVPEKRLASSHEQDKKPTPEGRRASQGDANADAMDVDSPAVVDQPSMEIKNEPSVQGDNQPAGATPDPSSAVSFLEGIHAFASQAEDAKSHSPSIAEQPAASATPSVRHGSTDAASQAVLPDLNLQPDLLLPSMPPYQHVPFHLSQGLTQRPEQKPAAPPLPPLPRHRQKAARNLLILESFPVLESLPVSNTISKRASLAAAGNTALQAISTILIPNSNAEFTADERKYLTTKHRAMSKKELTGPRAAAKEKEDLLPPAPAKPNCAITGKLARYRDAKTGLYYKDVIAAKAIQRVMANGTQYSPLLGVWSGIIGEGALGRVARGVPEGFWRGMPTEKLAEAKVETQGASQPQADVKVEQSAKAGPATAPVAGA